MVLIVLLFMVTVHLFDDFYRFFTVQVAAATSAGTGPFSSISVQTPTGGENYISQIKLKK